MSAALVLVAAAAALVVAPPSRAAARLGSLRRPAGSPLATAVEPAGPFRALGRSPLSRSPLSRSPLGRLAALGRRARRADRPVDADAPFALDLVAAALRAGLGPADALRVGAEVAGGPCDASAPAGPGGRRTRLAAAAARLDLGGDPARLATAGDDDPVLSALAEAFGGPAVTAPAATLERAATALRARVAAEAVARAERAGVLVAGPLGLCFLPAFVLLGVAPMIGDLAAGALPGIAP